MLAFIHFVCDFSQVNEEMPQKCSPLQFSFAFENILSDVMREMALDGPRSSTGTQKPPEAEPVTPTTPAEPVSSGGRRVDGRVLNELRPVACDGRPLDPSRVHGASLFSRGETQSLCIATVRKLCLNCDL